MTRQEIVTRVLHFIESNDSSEEAFNDLALYLFSYQYQHNIPFQAYCKKKGKTRRTVKTWRDIPPVPINGFKELTLSCEDPNTSEAVFMTSGTTSGLKGKHHHPTLEVYDRSMVLNFKERFIGDQGKIRMGILFPTEEVMPNSSLAHYLSLAKEHFGAKNSRYFVDENGLNINELLDELKEVEASGEPFALLGASFSFVHLLEALEQQHLSFTLPEGSKLFDTGGFKNQSKELDLDDFYDQLSAYLGVERSKCINMYGMTELSTQFYDAGNHVIPSTKSGPHWIRTRVVNPLTGKEVNHGERGVLVHCDLANFNSVTTILTEDMGVAKGEGFHLLGRVQGAEAKGCSIAVEELIHATKG